MHESSCRIRSHCKANELDCTLDPENPLHRDVNVESRYNNSELCLSTCLLIDKIKVSDVLFNALSTFIRMHFYIL